MPRFLYNGKYLSGQPASGFIKARDKQALELILVSSGIILEFYQPSLGFFPKIRLRFIGQSEITKITRQIQILLESGISIVEALILSLDQLKDNNLRQIFQYIINQIESGSSIESSLKAYPYIFDELYTSMVAAGELSGDLDKAFERVATYREKYENISKKVKSAMAYPILVILVAILVIFVLVFYVVPIFSSMYENFGAELPALTLKVISFTSFIKDHILSIIILLFLLIISIFLLYKSIRIKLLINKVLLNTPALKNLLLNIITARFCRTMGSLLTSGVDIIYSLNIATQTMGNGYAVTKLQPVAFKLAQGNTLTEALEQTQLFPKAMLRMTASGEKTGRLGEMLSRAADYYEKETDTTINTLTSLIEPVVIIFLGILIAFILVAMYLPLFDLVGAL